MGVAKQLPCLKGSQTSEAGFEQCRGRPSSRQSPKRAGRFARGFTVGEISARPRNKCLPRLRHWSPVAEVGCKWGQAKSDVRSCAGVQKAIPPLIEFPRAVSPSTDHQPAGGRLARGSGRHTSVGALACFAQAVLLQQIERLCRPSVFTEKVYRRELLHAACTWVAMRCPE